MLLLKMYLPFVIKLAQAIARHQQRCLCYLGSTGKLALYTSDQQETYATGAKKNNYQTVVQNDLANEVSPKSAVGKLKVVTPVRVYNQASSIRASPLSRDDNDDDEKIKTPKKQLLFCSDKDPRPKS